MLYYRYKELSEAGSENDDDTGGKKIVPDWCFNIGESVIDIEIVEDLIIRKETHILVLGERNFFCIKESGSLNYMKKLDYSPICFTNYILSMFYHVFGFFL